MSNEDDQGGQLADGRGGFLAVALAGLIVTTFGLGAWSAGARFFLQISVTDVIGAIAAVASTIAAIAAAYSAKFTREGADATRQSASAGLSSALATRETVIEMREARKDEQRPRLTLERKFLDFSFVCPGGINGGPLYRARTQYDPPVHSLPQFELTNHSDAPALDVSAEFWLEDTNGSFDINESYKHLGVQVLKSPCMPGEIGIDMVMFGAPLSSGVGHPIYKRMVEYRPFCGPRQSRLIDFPQGLLTTLFVRGLQYRGRQLSETPLHEVELVVTIACYTIAKERVETTFRFEIFPFCYGPNAPLEVYGHIRELPSNPIHDQRAI